MTQEWPDKDTDKWQIFLSSPESAFTGNIELQVMQRSQQPASAIDGLAAHLPAGLPAGH
jgi:hypothetical protein